MKQVFRSSVLGVAAVLLCLTAPAGMSAQGHPDLSGEWFYNDHIIPPTGGREHTPLSILMIKQTADKITLEAKAFQQDQPAISFRLDGKETVSAHKEGTARGTAVWQGPNLVLSGTKSYVSPAGEVKWTFKETYSLANGILTVERTETRGKDPVTDKFAFSKEPYKQAPMPANTSTKPGANGECPRDSVLFKACAMEMAKTYKAPRNEFGEPDLAGYWQIAGGLTGTTPAQGIEAQPPNPLWGGGRSMVIDPADGVIPYQPWAKEDREWRMKGENAALDSLVSACLAGIPRIETYSQEQWIRTKDQFVMFYEFHHNYRFVKMDGRPALDANIGGLWAGSARGHWEGETLVVETNQNNGKTYVDMQFVPLSSAVKVVERYTRVSPTMMWWEATITDPKVYSRPWTFGAPMRVNGAPNYELMESACAEDNREFSSQGVYRSFDFGRLRKEAEDRAKARSGGTK